MCVFAGGDAELEIFLGPLDLAGKDLILMAVNDNQSAEYAGGTHWYVHSVMVDFSYVSLALVYVAILQIALDQVKSLSS